MPTVGDRVKQCRLELGLSQDALAQRAGISKSFLSDLETRKRSVGAETLLDLGRAMGVSLDFLMTGEDSGDQKPEVQIPTTLANLAAEEGLSFRKALTLLHMQEQIIANRKSAKKNDLERVNWQQFYRAVKKFL
jgi:transcriptional regulator with XRE-family HTH domain